ncbi:MAG: hypothetical protein LBQ91_06765 [Oscillospiraceae bacterium]|jgi:hypothetical protein|nr:hypothetical protein [Oscillospiraceae bacterium]
MPNFSKYISINDPAAAKLRLPGYLPTASLSGGRFPGCLAAEGGFLTESFENAAPLTCAGTAFLYMFVGSDRANPESLNAQIEFQVEGETVTLAKTTSVYVPANAPHRIKAVSGLAHPIIFIRLAATGGEFEETAAESPELQDGAYVWGSQDGYVPPDGRYPEAPEGFLRLLLYSGSHRIPGAPYCELMWFLTKNDTGPAPHTHEFPEIIGFFGSDAKAPDTLGANVRFYFGEEYAAIDKPALICIPAGINHAPIIVPEMNTPIIHFSASGAVSYVKDGAEDNFFTV